jgi:hypothetical protein
MPKVDLQIRFADGRMLAGQCSFASPADQVAFEAEFNVPFPRDPMSARMTQFYWLIWRAAKRLDPELGTFEAFVESLDDAQDAISVEPLTEDPTKPGPPTAPAP